MNIIIINHYAGSIEMGMEFRPYYLAKEWIKLGHKVDVIAGDYSHLRKRNPNIEYDFQCEDIDGITYHWVRTGRYEGNGVKRALTMARFVRKLWINARKLVREIKPDVVISSSTYPIDTFAAQKIAKLANAKLIHEVHDMWPATLIEIGGMSKWNPFVVAMQIGENSAYKQSDYVVSLLPNTKEYMVRHGMKEEKFCHISNGIVLDDWNKPLPLPEKHKKVLDKCREEGKFVVGYFGGHALSNDLDILVDVAEMMKGNETVQIVLVGNGVEKQRLVDKAEEMNLDNICFLPEIPKGSIPSLLERIDCVYIGAKNSSLYRFGVAMNKIYDAMIGAKPLLYAVNAPNNYAERYNCGVSIEAGNKEALFKGIIALMGLSEKERIEMGNKGKAAVIEKYNYAILAKRFEKIFKEND